MSEIKPASASGAEALAEVVTAALRMQYEPVEDEISLAGVPTIALQSMTLYCFAVGIEYLALRLRDLAVCHEPRQSYMETTSCNKRTDAANVIYRPVTCFNTAVMKSMGRMHVDYLGTVT